jgi:tryptophan-rich sensory protein
MGIAAWLVWRERSAKARAVALALFVIQLAVNALWSWLFFAWHLGALAFADVVLLVVLVAVTVGAFWRVRPLAGAMLIPYLSWLVFAAALTWSVWQANPTLLK